MAKSESTESGVGKLRELVQRLRGPGGCPWDREQTLEDLRAYVVEEAHEVAAAISAGDADEIAAELGDLLFQVVFVACLAEEDGSFDLATVAERIHAKMVARHPHVFAEERLEDADAVRAAWERRKLAKENGEDASLLDGVPASLPALVGAYRMTQKAAGVGFDWPDAPSVLAKVREELGELEESLRGGGKEEIREEVGDLLFAVANLARHLRIDPEAALASGNLKFRRRFAAVEAGLRAAGKKLGEATLDEMDALWNEAKRHERTGE